MMKVLLLIFVALAVVGVLSGTGTKTDAKPHVFDELDVADCLPATSCSFASDCVC